jgi:DNA-binding LacI/PurR family transcriptional regulator
MVRRGSRVTSADVARLSGVSRSTVSYVLNDTPNQTIPEGTRRKVLEAAEHLGYTPHGPARALSRGRGSIVLLCLPDVPFGPAMGDLLEALALDLGAHELMLVTHTSGPAQPPALDLAALVAPVAVVGLWPFRAEEIAAFRARGARAVLPGPGDWKLWGEAGLGVGAAQIEHLAARGHRRIGYVHPVDPRLSVISRLRYEGAQETIRRLGCSDLSARRMPADQDFTLVLRAWLDEERITALAAYNDDVAFAVLHAARESGVRVPDDLAVIGVDDIAQARYACPPLTTVRGAGTPYGRLLAREVLRQLGVRPVPTEPAAYAADVVVRRST